MNLHAFYPISSPKPAWNYTVYISDLLSTRTLGANGPLVLAPAEGVGALQALCLFCCLFIVFFVILLSFCIFCLFAFLPFCLFVFLSFCLFAFLSFCIFAFLSFCHHYHNQGVHIYYHTNFCSDPTIFQFYHTFHHIFYHKFLPQTTTTIATHPPPSVRFFITPPSQYNPLLYVFHYLK